MNQVQRDTIANHAADAAAEAERKAIDVLGTRHESTLTPQGRATLRSYRDEAGVWRDILTSVESLPALTAELRAIADKLSDIQVTHIVEGVLIETYANEISTIADRLEE